MAIEWQSFLAICGMAAVTYLARIGGFWLVGRVTLSPRIEAGLRALPGAVLVSLVAPTVLSTGLAEVCAAVATVGVAVRTRSLLAAMIAGVVVVWGLRTLAHLT
jgi:uncharacterized membrane protein